MTNRVLLCPPTYFDVRDVKNPHMKGRTPVDCEKARGQWENLRGTLEAAGLQVETIDPVKDLEDMVFAANQVFVGYHEKIGKFIVPSEMRYLARQREVPFYVRWFHSRGYKVITLDLKGECLEGHGDLIWHPGHLRIWAGYGFRSTQRAVEKFSAAMEKLEITVVSLRLIDERCYHLDTCFTPLNSEAVLTYPGAFAPEFLDTVYKRWSRIYELSREEALLFICNGVVANGRYITPHLSENLNRALQKEGLEPVVVDTSEFEKSGGSAFCMKTFLY
jgi:N-dimethylarginine dimethylaminohydrolase